MSAPLLRLTGVGEGIEICIETTLSGADSPAKIAEAILQIFPEFPIPENCPEPVLGKGSNYNWKATKVDLAHYLELLHKQRILDTALDSMGKNLQGRTTSFELTRQAAMFGKIAFPYPTAYLLGAYIM